jgi:hypothetical protein
MKKLNSIIITRKINEEAHDACVFIYYNSRPIFGKKRKAEFDDKLSDAWEILRDFTSINKTEVKLHKLLKRGFAVEFTSE